jgi:hypothetical protein
MDSIDQSFVELFKYEFLLGKRKIDISSLPYFAVSMLEKQKPNLKVPSLLISKRKNSVFSIPKVDKMTAKSNRKHAMNRLKIKRENSSGIEYKQLSRSLAAYKRQREDGKFVKSIYDWKSV